MKTNFIKKLNTTNIKNVIVPSLFAAIVILCVLYSIKPKSDFWYDIYKDKMELKYWSAKDSLVTQIDLYIKQKSTRFHSRWIVFVKQVHRV